MAAPLKKGMSKTKGDKRNENAILVRHRRGIVHVSPVALAHHSFAMFDLARVVTVEAVVKEVQYTNPHVWIQIMVPDDKGGETEWSIEAGAPGMMTRAGWKSSTLKPGDKVTLGDASPKERKTEWQPRQRDDP